MQGFQRYNKAYAGGIGAALGLLVVGATEYFLQVDLAPMYENAIIVVCSAVAPLRGPANK